VILGAVALQRCAGLLSFRAAGKFASRIGSTPQLRVGIGEKKVRFLRVWLYLGCFFEVVKGP